MFVLSSEITIGTFRFRGVHEVEIKKTIHTPVQTAKIVLPSIGYVQYKSGGALPVKKTVGSMFQDGDPVVIKLGYNGKNREEFRGFVRRRNLNMPLEIECEGYSYLLRRNRVNGVFQKATIKELLEKAVSGLTTVDGQSVNIKVTAEVDTTLINFAAHNATGLDIINTIHKATDHNLAIFFINPTELWCGLPYTAYAQGQDLFEKAQVNCRLGYNVIKDNSLKERVQDDNPIEIEYHKKDPKGVKSSGSSKAVKFKQFRKYRQVLNQISTSAEMTALAQEKQYKKNYNGYEGWLNAFLQPYAEPGYIANIYDARYPERDGAYMVESTEVTFGGQGARRKMEIGHKVGWDKSKQI